MGKINGVAPTLQSNNAEIKQWLLNRGISAFKRLAGPPFADLSEFESLPTFTVMQNYMSDVHWAGENNRCSFARLILKCDEPMCNKCSDMLELAIQPKRDIVQFQIWYHWDDETCAFCGGLCHDEIPF